MEADIFSDLAPDTSAGASIGAAVMVKVRIQFRTLDGILLRGDYFPVNVEMAPIVIMTPGFSLLKESYLDDTAQKMQENGIAALIYDHRGWGSSEGVPRQETKPMQQAEDYHDAVTFARSLKPAIDPGRIALWGVGASGGAAAIAFADDARVKTAVLNMPLITGSRKAISHQLQSLLQEAMQEREQQVMTRTRAPIYVPVWDSSPAQAAANEEAARYPPSLLADPQNVGRMPFFHGEKHYRFISEAVVRSTAAGTRWENKITLQSFYHISHVEPQDWLLKVKAPRPFLYVAAVEEGGYGLGKDYHRQVFDRVANTAAKFVVAKSFFECYAGRDVEVQRAQLDFLRENL